MPHRLPAIILAVVLAVAHAGGAFVDDAENVWTVLTIDPKGDALNGPGADAAQLADPANAWLGRSFVDAWNRYSTNTNIQSTTVPGAGVLMFHDQPRAAADAIIGFLDRIGVPAARR